MIYDGDTIQKAGRTFRVNFEHDGDHGAPWEESDCHGIVSDWTTRDKRPGERILSQDRGSKRYYDIKATLEIARRDWGLGDKGAQFLAGKLGHTPTKKEIAVEAVERDFDYLRRWCADQWHYVGVIVTDVTDKEFAQTDYSHALWGVEDDDNAYLEQVAGELISDILGELEDAAKAAQKERDEVLYWNSRDIPTLTKQLERHQP